jgi:hypothetical protein
MPKADSKAIQHETHSASAQSRRPQVPVLPLPAKEERRRGKAGAEPNRKNRLARKRRGPERRGMRKMKPVALPPNIPVTVALVDPEGAFDFEMGVGRYQTTAGELLALPRPAVLLLNDLEPAPGEEIEITKHWTGKIGEKSTWTISKAGAKAEKSAQEPAADPPPPDRPPEAPRRLAAVPTPIRKPSRGRPAENQPSLFDFARGERAE